MITIHKLKVKVGQCTIDVPHNAKIIDFREKHGELFVWVLLDTTADTQPRELEIVGSGKSINGRYIKTAHGANRNTLHLIEV